MPSPETEFQITDLLKNMTKACTESAEQLARKQWPADMPHSYVIPSMELTLRMEMSYSDGKVKGVFRKHSTTTESIAMSEINMKIVAVPLTS